MDPALNQRWSTRRVMIKDRQGELAARFQRDHGRPPTPVEALQLAQQATLETRDAKHEPRTLTEQRATWHTQAAETLGGPHAVQAMISRALNPISMTSPTVDAEWVTATAEQVLDGGGGTPFDLADLACPRRSATPGPGRTGPHRQSRSAGRAARRPRCCTPRSISLTRTDDGIAEPAALASGRRLERLHRRRIASCSPRARILAAEQRLVAAAGRTDGRALDAGTVELALLESAANGNALDAGQAALVRSMCTSGCAAAAGDRPRWRRKNHRHAHADSGVARQRRPRARVGPVRRRGGATPRRHRRTGRHAGQAHLVHPPQ